MVLYGSLWEVLVLELVLNSPFNTFLMNFGALLGLIQPYEASKSFTLHQGFLVDLESSTAETVPSPHALVFVSQLALPGHMRLRTI